MMEGEKVPLSRWDKLVFIVLTQHSDRGKAISRGLLSAGAAACGVATSISQAERLRRCLKAPCIVFDRVLVKEWEAFFQCFGSRYTWFVPVAEEKDNYDVIEGLNTGRLSYYLIQPIHEKDLKATVETLEQRMKWNTWR